MNRPPPRLPKFGDRRHMRIGLLGGSFNPAHAGHLHIAQLALKRLQLHQVWLLVSPGNPLKPTQGMATQKDRLTSAQKIADGRQLIATDLESRLGTHYTIDTLKILRQRFPNAHFVWLMGADNFIQFPRWRRWKHIAATIPIAILPRPTYTHTALAGQSMQKLRRARRPSNQAPILADQPAPAWIFLTARQNALSATMLRETASGDPPSPANPSSPRQPNPNAAPQNPP